MRHTIYLALSLTILTIASSCAKTNVRKLSEDWKVEYEEIAFDVTGIEIPFGETRTLTGTTATRVFKSGSSTDYEEETLNGAVELNEFIIRKDGTWSRTRKYHLNGNDEIPGVLYYEYVASGTWSFVRKSKSEGFKRNDRVVFNTLNVRIYDRQVMDNDIHVMDDYTQTLQTGEATTTYVVKSSDKDNLELEMIGERTFQYNNSDYSATEQVNILKMKAK